MLRIIGDVHGQVDFVLRRDRPTYLEIIQRCDCSVQLGDMGDAETYAVLASLVDDQMHRFLAGNHDHYDCLPRHALGDYGRFQLGGVEFFFVRGARSGDKQILLQRGRELSRKLWFEQEELSEAQLDAALGEYRACRPRIVLSHASPSRITKFVHAAIRQRDPYQLARNSKPSPTTETFERMLEVHRPELWCFGHHHHDWHYHEEGTDFRCVGELSYLDLVVSSKIEVILPSRKSPLIQEQSHG